MHTHRYICIPTDTSLLFTHRDYNILNSTSGLGPVLLILIQFLIGTLAAVIHFIVLPYHSSLHDGSAIFKHNDSRASNGYNSKLFFPNVSSKNMEGKMSF